MNALLLLAGSGSRLGRPDLPHKVLLPFGGETLLSRHLRILDGLGIEETVLVVGHNKDAVQDAASAMSLSMAVRCVDNDLYQTTGNTLSLIMGLQEMEGDVLVLDGDVLYPPPVIGAFLQGSRPPAFAVVAADIDDAECAKALLHVDGTIAALVTKRVLTQDEKDRHTFAGEAIGFFTLSAAAAAALLQLYAEREEFFKPTLWEVLFSEAAQETAYSVFHVNEPGCFEIDTPEDVAQAQAFFDAHPDRYLLP
ncbi:MAG: NTP transferase domain-containing protein [Nitrospinaceae bacterium]